MESRPQTKETIESINVDNIPDNIYTYGESIESFKSQREKTIEVQNLVEEYESFQILKPLIEMEKQEKEKDQEKREEQPQEMILEPEKINSETQKKTIIPNQLKEFELKQSEEEKTQEIIKPPFRISKAPEFAGTNIFKTERKIIGTQPQDNKAKIFKEFQLTKSEEQQKEIINKFIEFFIKNEKKVQISNSQGSWVSFLIIQGDEKIKLSFKESFLDISLLKQSFDMFIQKEISPDLTKIKLLKSFKGFISGESESETHTTKINFEPKITQLIEKEKFIDFQILEKQTSISKTLQICSSNLTNQALTIQMSNIDEFKELYDAIINIKQ
jgi:hypothetical protein